MLMLREDWDLYFGRLGAVEFEVKLTLAHVYRQVRQLPDLRHYIDKLYYFYPVVLVPPEC